MTNKQRLITPTPRISGKRKASGFTPNSFKNMRVRIWKVGGICSTPLASKDQMSE